MLRSGPCWARMAARRDTCDWVSGLPFNIFSLVAIEAAACATAEAYSRAPADESENSLLLLAFSLPETCPISFNESITDLISGISNFCCLRVAAKLLMFCLVPVAKVATACVTFLALASMSAADCLKPSVAFFISGVTPEASAVTITSNSLGSFAMVHHLGICTGA